MSEIYEVRQALESPETQATVLHAIIRAKYGEQVYDWDPLTVYLEVKDDFRADMIQQAQDRWCAISTAVVTDVFFTQIDAFMALCNTLSTGSPFFDVFDPVTVEEAAWGITEVSLNRQMLPFGSAIRNYLKLILQQDGYSGDYPDIFDYALGERTEGTGYRQIIVENYTSNDNKNVVDTYINDNLRDMVTQFNRIPSLSNIDNILLQLKGSNT